MATRTNATRAYNRNYIAIAGKTILAAGKNRDRVGSAGRKAAPGAEVRVVFAAQALVDRYKETGRNVRFVVGPKGKANLMFA